MAAFEKLDVEATEEDLRQSLFGERPAAYALLAFSEGKPAAYAIYFFSYSSMRGRRCLWLDDLFVDPAFRGRGIAGAFMSYLADIAVRNGCARFEWIVLDWNDRAIRFYNGLGASILDDWRVCRIEGEAMKRLASRTGGG